MTDSSVPETYAHLADGMAAVIATLTSQQWDRPSPCDGWTARDVLAHLIDTQREYFAGHELPLGERPDLTDPSAAWSAHTAAVREILADPQVPDRSFDGHFGPTTVGEALLQFYGFDLIAHRWDLAAVTESPYRFGADELDWLERSISGWGQALYMEGICAPAVEVDADADRQSRVLAALGRAG
ncbi:TIGR03086 family metal-binding protein [Mycobacterium sp. NPDC003323]